MSGLTSTNVGITALASLVLVFPALADGIQRQDDIRSVTEQLQRHSDEMGIAISGISFEMEAGKCTVSASLSEPMVLTDVPAGAAEITVTVSSSAGGCGDAGAMLEDGIASIASSTTDDVTRY